MLFLRRILSIYMYPQIQYKDKFEINPLEKRPMFLYPSKGRAEDVDQYEIRNSIIK